MPLLVLNILFNLWLVCLGRQQCKRIGKTARSFTKPHSKSWSFTDQLQQSYVDLYEMAHMYLLQSTIQESDHMRWLLKTAEHWESVTQQGPSSLIFQNYLKLHIGPGEERLNSAKKVCAQVVAVTDRHFGALFFLNIALHHEANQFVRINKSEQASPFPSTVRLALHYTVSPVLFNYWVLF